MIISRTPFRMSFFGGGTDYPAWFREHGGCVLTTSIDKYCYITCRYLPPFFDHLSRVVYSKVETVKSNSEIEHPAVRGILKHMDIARGVEIHHDGDLPARTGLGSSSSFAVGLLHALRAMQHEMPEKMELALEAIRVEQEVLKENVGCQDQVIAAFGGLNRIDFKTDGTLSVSPLTVSRERAQELRSHCLLYFTGFSRIASEIVKEQLKKMKDRGSELKRMQAMVPEAIKILAGKGDLTAFGKLLHEAWTIKRTLSSKVSSEAIDQIYDEARSAGALGGKLLGAGGGGFMLIFAKPEDHPKVQQRLKRLMRIPFDFESDGSRILHYQPEASPEA